jgi:hypothetical protein
MKPTRGMRRSAAAPPQKEYPTMTLHPLTPFKGNKPLLPRFLTIDQRGEGVCEAARIIVQRTCNLRIL